MGWEGEGEGEGGWMAIGRGREGWWLVRWEDGTRCHTGKERLHGRRIALPVKAWR